MVPGGNPGRSIQNNTVYDSAIRNMRAGRVLCSTADEKLPCGIRYSHRGVAHYLDGRVQLSHTTCDATIQRVYKRATMVFVSFTRICSDRGQFKKDNDGDFLNMGIVNHY